MAILFGKKNYGKEPKKDIFKHNVLEPCKLNLDLLLSEGHDDKHYKTELVAENSEYYFFRYKAFENGVGGYILRRSKKNLDEIVYLGESKYMCATYKNFLFMTDRNAELGKFLLLAQDIKTGEVKRFNCFSPYGEMKVIGGYGRYYSQDEVLDIIANDESLVLKVRRTKISEKSIESLGGPVDEHVNKDIEYQLIITYENGTFRSRRNVLCERQDKNVEIDKQVQNNHHVVEKKASSNISGKKGIWGDDVKIARKNETDATEYGNDISKIIELVSEKRAIIYDICMKKSVKYDSNQCNYWTWIFITSMVCALYYKRIKEEKFNGLKKALCSCCEKSLSSIDPVSLYYAKTLIPIHIDAIMKEVPRAFNQEGILTDEKFIELYIEKFISKESHINKIKPFISMEVSTWIKDVESKIGAISKGFVNEKEVGFVFNGAMEKVNFLNAFLTQYGAKSAIENNKEAFVVETLLVCMYFYEILLTESGYSKEDIFDIISKVLEIMDERVCYYDLDELDSKYIKTRRNLDGLPSDEKLKECNPFVSSAIYYLTVCIRGFDTSHLDDAKYEQMVMGVTKVLTDIVMSEFQ